MRTRSLLLMAGLTIAALAGLSYSGGTCPYSAESRSVAEAEAAKGDTVFSTEAEDKPTCNARAKSKDKTCDKARSKDCGECPKGKATCEACPMKGAANQVADALDAVEKAHAALEKGETESAAKHLAAARELLSKTHTALTTPHCGRRAAAATDLGPEGPRANTHCPIMGNKIDHEKAPAKLTTEFHGQKVAFCCGGCVPAWEKLTDAEKLQALRKTGNK